MDDETAARARALRQGWGVVVTTASGDGGVSCRVHQGWAASRPPAIQERTAGDGRPRSVKAASIDRSARPRAHRREVDGIVAREHRDAEH